MGLKKTIEKIDELRSEIDALRPINDETEQRIMQKFRLDWNYHSNNLEGNSLTFGETKSFLLHGITAEGKPLKDHLDLKGHNEAILLIDEIVKGNRPLTETFLREIHEIILHEPYDRPAQTADGKATTKRIEIGQYKKTPNHVKTVTGEIFYFATPEETPAQMNDLMDWFAKASVEGKDHPLSIAAMFHYRFIRIHPFDDGNGRMARILMNLILMKFGYPPVIIKTDKKREYFRALQTADGGDVSYFVNYIGEQLTDSMQLFLRGAKGESIEEVDDVDKEIAMLKAELRNKSHKIIYDVSTAQTIYEESLVPLLGIIFNKLDQFNELFNSVLINDSIDSDATQLHIGSLQDLGEINYVIERSILDATESFNLPSSISISCLFKEFLKTEDKLFNVELNFRITLNRFDFKLDLLDTEIQTFKIFYHNKNDEKKFQKIANTMAKHVLGKIKEKLAG